MKLPRSKRMRQRSEFLRVRRKGRSCRGRFMVLSCLRDETLPDFKFGFVTSRRVGNAVARVRVRRRLRSIARKEAESLNPGHYVVLIARAGAAEASFAELKEDWLALVRRCGLLRRDAVG